METIEGEQQLQTFINIPKVELHAHLNGSLSQKTLKKLYHLKKAKCHNDLDLSTILCPPRDLKECFKLFSIIHGLTDTPESVYMATCDVIQDFFNDGVHHLELRTTPRETESFINQETYVETVLKAINETVNKLNGRMNVKLLLSIDRKRSVHFAQETIKIAEKYFTSSQTVVGIDFSGDPTVGNVHSFIPLLEHAKRVNLKLAIHVSEVPGVNEEVKDLLKLYPQRLGHGTFLHPSRGGCVENFSVLNQLKVPLEICLSSNVFCKSVPSYEEHHFKLFREMNYPCVLCTDDKGIFNTSLSKEYYLASKYYRLTENDLFDLSYNSIYYTFSSNFEKNQLRKMWKPRRLSETSVET